MKFCGPLLHFRTVLSSGVDFVADLKEKNISYEIAQIPRIPSVELSENYFLQGVSFMTQTFAMHV
jgi:hypothetical protein